MGILLLVTSENEKQNGRLYIYQTIRAIGTIEKQKFMNCAKLKWNMNLLT